MSLVLGLDCGGTKTSAVVVRDGVEIGRGYGGPANLASSGVEQFAESIRAAAEQAMTAASCPPDTSFDRVGLAMAGYSASKRHAEAEAAVSQVVRSQRCVLMPDYEAALWGAAPNGVGVVAIAGTGAVVYGRDHAGRELRLDGLGFLLGDEGGGADVGIRALRFVAHELEHIGERSVENQSLFVHQVLAHVGETTLAGVLEKTYSNLSGHWLAEIGGLVVKLANEGDHKAIRQIQGAAGRLKATTSRCRMELNILSEPVYLLGGFAGASAIYREAFAGPSIGIRLSEPAHDAAYGAALVAGLQLSPPFD